MVLEMSQSQPTPKNRFLGKEIMSQREGKHDKTDKFAKTNAQKKRERPVLLKYLLKALR